MRRSLNSPDLYINRESSWLAFNRRVLEEAKDGENPLLERVKFLAITASNLDEFFEVRVSSLLQKIEDGLPSAGPDGLNSEQQREMINRETHDLVNQQYECWNTQLRPQLAKENIFVRELLDLDKSQLQFADEYCERELDPLLTPITVDPAHPFPRVINKALCLAFLLRRKRRAAMTYMGVMTVPRVLPRVVRLPGPSGEQHYIFLADLLTHHASRLYKGYEIIAASSFRVTRNSNLYLQEEESRNLLETVRTELHNRRKGDAVRLEIDADATPEIVDRLQRNFELDNWQVYRTEGPVNLSRLFNFYEQVDRPELKFRPFSARELVIEPKNQDIFGELRKRDILLHHPFDSYSGVVDFITSAAEDPRVISLKQTIYRTGPESPIGQALIDSAADKEVTVVVELTARFDEASNIRWSKTMEDAGIQVFHGLVGLKTHCKLALLVRRDPDGVMRHYVHIGTGNYNQTTSRFYTDLSFMTSNTKITAAVHAFFNYLTAYAERKNYEPLAVAPINLAETVVSQIRRETDHAVQGKPARIIAKMNALLEPNVVKELYAASQAGVQIDLIVRGMCALRPGIPGVSENIRVRSVVGRLLEHSRIFYFLNNGADDVYISSADWMPRNFYERAEVCCPINDPRLKKRLLQEILPAYLADNVKARVLNRDGSYSHIRHARAKVFNAQEFLIEMAENKAGIEDIPEIPVPISRKRPRRRKAPSVMAAKGEQ